MLNASVGVQRVLGRVRRTPEHPRSAGEPRQERGRAAARRVRHGIQAIVAASQLVPLRDTQPAVELSAVEDPSRRSLIARLGPDRAVAFALAGILLGASALSVSAGGPVPATEASTGDAAALHLVAGGRTGGTGGTLPNVPRLAETDRTGSVEFGQPDQRTAPRASFAPLDLRAATVAASEPATAGDTVTGGDPATNTDPATSSDAATNSEPATGDPATSGDPAGTGDASTDGRLATRSEPTTDEDHLGPTGHAGTISTEIAAVGVEGPFIDDGTLVKPIAVDTNVPDGSELVKAYTVKPGDTLAGIAAKYSVSVESVWWANDLTSQDDIQAGQTLRIPPVDGLIVKVAATDTLDAIAARYTVAGADILKANALTDPNLVVGQVLVIPGAKGAPMPVVPPPPKPEAQPAAKTPAVTALPPATYAGGRFVWPVVGGKNYVSQYFHYGHYAIDIAATYGSTVRAAGEGVVTFAGWGNNGGGYQVWIAHGSGLFTTYNHMSAVTVGVGQHVDRGQQVGRIGQTGNATGPHLHFEVWRGPVDDGGQRVNPMSYF